MLWCAWIHEKNKNKNKSVFSFRFIKLQCCIHRKCLESYKISSVVKKASLCHGAKTRPWAEHGNSTASFLSVAPTLYVHDYEKDITHLYQENTEIYFYTKHIYTKKANKQQNKTTKIRTQNQSEWAILKITLKPSSSPSSSEMLIKEKGTSTRSKNLNYK